MERRLELASLALITVVVRWFYARHLPGIWTMFPIGAILAGGACGAYASRKRWWLPFVPRPALAQSGIALSFAFSSTRALAIRAAAYSVEYFG